MNKIVYAGFCVDLLHSGHINIVNKAREIADKNECKLVCGVMTDEAMESYKRKPILPYTERKFLLESIKGVDEVIPSETWNYVPNLRLLKPAFLVHGNDWNNPKEFQFKTRTLAVEALKEWGGVLIEPEYTKGISTTMIINKIKES